MAERESLEALAERALAAVRARGWTVALAESCTGGLIGDLLTEIPGASDVFVGGVVAYAEATKRALLDVPAATLERHGAVSAQTARAMAAGARRRLGAQVAVAVTGIAGPGGGSPEKPVGLTYVAIADPAGEEVERHTWAGDRRSNKLASAQAALALLIRRAGGGE